MVERCAIVETVNGVERHGLIGALEQRRSFMSFQKPPPHADEVFVEPAPPVPHT